MNKTKRWSFDALVAAVASRLDISARDARVICREYNNVIADALRNGAERVRIENVGIIRGRWGKARHCRMPGDLEAIAIPPRWQLKFKTSTALKEDLDAMIPTKKGGAR
jgi:nucleoid DNA-binding protein